MNTYKTKTERTLRWFLFLLWLAVVLLLDSRHENWLDEAQAWLLARDLNLAGLFRQMSFEGHPCLWHLILMPFAKLGFPYRTMNLISTALVAAAVALMLWKSPIPLPLQAAALFGCAFLHQLPVISRSYALIPLFLFLNAMFWPARRERPFRYGLSLALLVQTHLYMVPMAGIVSVIWLAETLQAFRKDGDRRTLLRQGLGLALPLASFVLFLLQVSGSKNSSSYLFNARSLLPSALLRKNIELIAGYVDTPILLQYFPTWLTGHRVPVFLAVMAFLYVPAALVFLQTLRQQKAELAKAAGAYLLGVTSQLVLSLLFARTMLQKTAILLVLMLWLLWLVWPEAGSRQIKALLLCGCLGLELFFLGLDNTVLHDIKNPYSDSCACAAYIRDKLPEDAVIFTFAPNCGTPLLPLLERDSFYDAVYGKPMSFVPWTHQNPQVTTYEALRAWAREIDPKAQEAYLIFWPQYTGPFGDILAHCEEEDLLYCYTDQDPPAIQDNYYLFRLRLSPAAVDR